MRLKDLFKIPFFILNKKLEHLNFFNVKNNISKQPRYNLNNTDIVNYKIIKLIFNI